MLLKPAAMATRAAIAQSGIVYDQRSSGRTVSREQPLDGEREADPRHHEHGRLREEDDAQPGQAGPHQPLRRRVGPTEIERQEQEENRCGGVHLVLLHLGTVAEERNRDGAERDGERHAPSVERALREPPEEHEPHDTREERKQPQRQLVLAKENRREALGEEKASRRHLVELERLGQQLAERKADDVAGEKDLIEPERSVRQVRPHAQRHAQQDERGQQATHSAGSRREVAPIGVAQHPAVADDPIPAAPQRVHQHRVARVEHGHRRRAGARAPAHVHEHRRVALLLAVDRWGRLRDRWRRLRNRCGGRLGCRLRSRWLLRPGRRRWSLRGFQRRRFLWKRVATSGVTPSRVGDHDCGGLGRGGLLVALSYLPNLPTAMMSATATAPITDQRTQWRSAVEGRGWIRFGGNSWPQRGQRVATLSARWPHCGHSISGMVVEYQTQTGFRATPAPGTGSAAGRPARSTPSPGCR